MYLFQLKIKSANKKSLKLYISFLRLIFLKLNIFFTIIILPKKIKKVILLKSPHVYKKAWEQFQIIRYTSCFFFNSQIPPKLLKFFLVNKPKNIRISIKKS